jgi:uncharacterized protein YecE (DUF72 family)
MNPPPRQQPSLFELPAQELPPQSPSAEHLALAAALPDQLVMGAMTWSYPGWAGVVYARPHNEKQLAAYGLTAYARHPLLRAVEIDRSYYEPLSAEAFDHYASQVPDAFRFVVKAHEDCTVQRYPQHARYGQKRGLINPRFLDAEYATRAVVEPLGRLGARLFAVLFQFSPLDMRESRGPREFADRLQRFFTRLPAGFTYAVELRNDELLTRDYAAALDDTGAIHCHNAWTFMPSVLEQAKRLPASTRRPLLIRWLLKQNDRYEQASARYAPFSRIVDEDPHTRMDVARLAAKALAHGVPACVLVDNKAEGCAPESIARLAQALVSRVSIDDARDRTLRK